MLLFIKTVYPFKAEICATIKILAPICLGSTLGSNKRGGLLFIFLIQGVKIASKEWGKFFPCP